MTQGWQFPQNGTMPRYMNDSRYFSLGANPITLDAARQRNGLALPDAANFTHIPNEMDAWVIDYDSSLYSIWWITIQVPSFSDNSSDNDSLRNRYYVLIKYLFTWYSNLRIVIHRKSIQFYIYRTFPLLSLQSWNSGFSKILEFLGFVQKAHFRTCLTEHFIFILKSYYIHLVVGLLSSLPTIRWR